MSKKGVSILDAGKSGDLESIKQLLSGDSTLLKVTDEAGMTVLHKAACYGHTPVIVALLDVWQADINQLTSTGKTPLHFAAWKGHLDTVRAIVSRGADVDLRASNGQAAIDMATMSSQTAIVDFLAKEMKSPPSAKVSGKELSQRAQDLLLAAGFTQELIDKGGSAHAGLTPFIMAAFNNDINTLRILQKYTSNVNEQDAAGMTAMHWAYFHKNDEMIQQLLAWGADVALRNNKGLLPQDFAQTSFLSAFLKDADSSKKTLKQKKWWRFWA